MSVIKRFTRTLLPIVGFGFIVLTSWGTAYSSDTSPNILLVIADDMGIDASPCYSVGKVKPNMPVIEEMCRSGVVFENVWANPQCSPTRATHTYRSLRV